eukprot:359540-Chlamydomonas_euryale.AAC.1
MPRASGVPDLFQRATGHTRASPSSSTASISPRRTGSGAGGSPRSSATAWCTTASSPPPCATYSAPASS